MIGSMLIRPSKEFVAAYGFWACIIFEYGSNLTIRELCWWQDIARASLHLLECYYER